MSMHDNVMMGLAGLGHGRLPADVRREVIEACTAVLAHEIHQTSTQSVPRKAGIQNQSISNPELRNIQINYIFFEMETVK